MRSRPFSGWSGDSLQAARMEAEAGLERNAIASAYFAAHQAARALLASKGKSARTHRGILLLLRTEFVEQLPADVLAWLARLQDLRESSHYDWTFEPAAGQAEKALANAGRFVEEATRVLTK